MPLKQYLRLSKEVSNALEDGKPVVALESAVVTHGLPYPDNLETTLAMLEAVTSQGAVPAITLINNGRINIGLSADEVESLAKSVLKDGGVAYKTSVSDLGPLLARQCIGSTTVAATMFCASLAGIQVFATGGIGGVHRGAAETFDISNDLHSLRDIPMAVVASGAKSILDIPKTLEVLETFGVCIVGYNTNTFPSFYGPGSNHKLIHHTDSMTELADMVDLQLMTGHGVIVANPILAEHAIADNVTDGWIKKTMEEASELNIKGKVVTPFMLRRLSELSKGQTLAANKDLLVNNAKVAAQLALQTAS